MDQNGRVALGRYRPVQLGPFIWRATNRSRVNPAEQERQAARSKTGEQIRGTSKVRVTFDRNPVPARSKNRRQARPYAQIRELPRPATRDKADNDLACHRMVQHTRVHYRSLNRGVRKTGHDHREPTLPGAELSRSLE